MFVDFNRVFNESDMEKTNLPVALVKYLSSELPDGLRYMADENGYCHIMSESASLTIGGFQFDLSEDQKKILGDNATLDDVLKYSYNSQRTIPLNLIKPGMIILNGQEVPIEKMSYNPYNPIKGTKHLFFAEPPKFSGSFQVSIGGNGYETVLDVARVPNESVNVSKYESKDDKPLKIVYYLNEVDKSTNLTMTAQLKNAETVQELLETMQIYNAYISGKGNMCGIDLKEISNIKNRKRFNSKTIKFWEKVLKLEQLLRVEFVLPYDDITYNTACEVEQLYQNLIMNKPIRDNRQIESLKSGCEVNNEEQIKNSIGGLLMFQFEGTQEFNLFGVKRTLPCFVCIFNAKLKDYYRENDKFKLMIEDKSSDEPMFSSTLCFADEEKLALFKDKIKKTNSNFTSITKKFEKAKKVPDYL